VGVLVAQRQEGACEEAGAEMLDVCEGYNQEGEGLACDACEGRIRSSWHWRTWVVVGHGMGIARG